MGWTKEQRTKKKKKSLKEQKSKEKKKNNESKWTETAENAIIYTYGGNPCEDKAAASNLITERSEHVFGTILQSKRGEKVKKANCKTEGVIH